MKLLPLSQLLLARLRQRVGIWRLFDLLDELGPRFCASQSAA